MEEFISKLITSTEAIRKEREESLGSLKAREKEALQKSLLPITKELDRLIHLGVKFLDGTPFRYSVELGGIYHGGVIIPTKFPCYIHIGGGDKTRKLEFRRSWGRNQVGEGYSSLKFAKPEDLLLELADYLAEFIGDLGLADKSVYSQKTQDTIGID
jgi:hypothetical protein